MLTFLQAPAFSAKAADRQKHIYIKYGEKIIKVIPILEESSNNIV
jgi:hypothetical protein